MNNKLWRAKWKRNDIACHQPVINPLLQQILPRLDLSAGDCILVPLCGKSLDMHWLTHSGLRVIGVELSAIAVKAYFESCELKPRQQRQGPFMRWSHDDIEIWCGDIFDLTRADMSSVKSLYDCAVVDGIACCVSCAICSPFSENIADGLPDFIDDDRNTG